MIAILGHIICRITPLLILFLYTSIFVQCIVKKKQKKGTKLTTSPPDKPNNPSSPGTTSTKPKPQPNTTYQIMKGRQKPMAVFDEEVTKSVPKTPKSKSVEETSMKVPRNHGASNSSKFDSSASVHEKETTVPTVLPPPKTETPAKKDDSVEDNTENNSVDSDEK